jgi:putative salt-induced outer membrane protein
MKLNIFAAAVFSSSVISSAFAVYVPEAEINRDPAASMIMSNDDKSWSGQAELSLLSTTGNTETLSLGVKTIGKKNWQDWSILARAEYLQTRDAERITAESFLFGLRGTRKFQSFDLFLDNEFQRNEFAGFTNLYKFSLGLGREVVKTATQVVRIEVGPAFVVEERVSQETVQFGSLSTQLLHQWSLSEKVKLNNRLAHLANLSEMSDSRYEFEFSFAAPISDLFSLKASYLAQYRNQPPKAAENFDGKTMLSLLATF